MTVGVGVGVLDVGGSFQIMAVVVWKSDPHTWNTISPSRISYGIRKLRNDFPEVVSP